MGRNIEELDNAISFNNLRLEEQQRRIQGISDYVRKIEVKMGKLETIVEGMNKLPDAMNDLKLSIVEMKSSIDALRTQYEKTEMKINDVEESVYNNSEKGKFDLLKWATNNLVQILLFIALLMQGVKING